MKIKKKLSFSFKKGLRVKHAVHTKSGRMIATFNTKAEAKHYIRTGKAWH